MRATSMLCAGHVHKPLIRFLGKRTPSPKSHIPHPHPAAPPEVAARFNDFLRRFNSSSQISATPRSISPNATGKNATQFYHEFWHAPSRYWEPSRQITETEIEAIASGGASMK